MSAISANISGKIFVDAVLRPRELALRLTEQGPSNWRTGWLLFVTTIVNLACSFYDDFENNLHAARGVAGLEAVEIFGLGNILRLVSVELFNIVCFAVMLFLWLYLFRFREQMSGVRALVDSSIAFGPANAVGFSILFTVLLRFGFSSDVTIYVTGFFFLVVLLSYGTVYASSALNISTLKSALFNMAELAILFVLMALYVVTSGVFSGGFS